MTAAQLAHEVARFCKEQVTDPQRARGEFPSSPLWAAVRKTGTALWLDTGDIDAARELWVREFDALTTNNTLLNKEVQKGLRSRTYHSGRYSVLRENGVHHFHGLLARYLGNGA